MKISKEDAVKLAEASIICDYSDKEKERRIIEIITSWQIHGYIEGVDAVKISEDYCESDESKRKR